MMTMLSMITLIIDRFCGAVQDGKSGFLDCELRILKNSSPVNEGSFSETGMHCSGLIPATFRVQTLVKWPCLSRSAVKNPCAWGRAPERTQK